MMKVRGILAVAITLICSWSFCATKAHAKVLLPPIFGNGMVLQRDQKTQVWGQAASGESITVEIAGQRRCTSADARGHWQVELLPIKSGFSCIMSVKGTNTIAIKDIQIGDVWICSGQSNMNFPLGASDFQGEPVPAALTSRLRTFSMQPQSTSDGVCTGWISANNHSALALPAIPFLFGRILATEEGIPIGIIMAACDGAPLETFFPEETVQRMHCADRILCAPHKTGAMFQTLLLPILRFKVRGIIWYQGESNLLNAASYKSEFPAFIEDLRARFKAPELPFLFVQLPNFGFRQPDKAPADSFWADMRAAQQDACRLTNVYMVVSIDTAASDAKLLHPKEKFTISARLAQVARAITAGMRPPISPTVECQKIEDDSIILSMKNANDRLSTRSGDKPQGFQLAGADKKFYWADAEIKGNCIKVTCDEVVDPVAVRYAWADNPACNIYYADLPLAPFRTDLWITRPKLNPAAFEHIVSR